MVYPDLDPKVTQDHPLNWGEKGLLCTFVHYVHYREDINDPIDNKCTQDMFNQFHCNIKYTRQLITLSNLQHIPIVATTQTPAPTPTVPKPSTPSLVDMFKNGIKRDTSVNPTLKDELWNDNWYRSFVNQANR
jgi:hypothetical protein